MRAQLLSHVQLFATPCTAVLQAPLSMGILNAEYWSGLPCPPPENLPHPGIEPTSALAGRFFTAEPSGKLQNITYLQLRILRTNTNTLVLITINTSKRSLLVPATKAVTRIEVNGINCNTTCCRKVVDNIWLF